MRVVTSSATNNHLTCLSLLVVIQNLRHVSQLTSIICVSQKSTRYIWRTEIWRKILPCMCKFVNTFLYVLCLWWWKFWTNDYLHIYKELNLSVFMCHLL